MTPNMDDAATLRGRAGRTGLWGTPIARAVASRHRRRVMGAAARIAAAQVIGSFAGGGAERLAYNLAVGLGAAGARSYAIALRRAGLSEPPPPGVEVVELWATPRDRRSVLRGMAQLRRLVAAERINVVHVHGLASLPLCALALMGLRPRPRLLFTWHGAEGVLRGPRREPLLRWALSRCDRVYAPSRAIAEELTQRARVRRPATVFRNGVEDPGPAAAQRGSAWNDEPLIVWAARVVPTKDPQTLLRALGRLRREGLRFRAVLAGSAPVRMQWYADRTREMVEELGLSGVVEMPGWVRDTAGLFRSGSIAVQSSVTEGLSLSLLEQMMAGLAVVATDVGDTAEAVIDGRTGLLVPHSDEGALTDALRRVVADAGLRARLGEAAREHALREFSIARMAERAVEEYVEVLGEGS